MESCWVELRKRKPYRRAGDKLCVKGHPVFYVRQRGEGSQRPLVKLGELFGRGIDIEGSVSENFLGGNALQDPGHLALIVATDGDVMRVRTAINWYSPIALIGESNMARGAIFDTDFQCIRKGIRERN